MELYNLMNATFVCPITQERLVLPTRIECGHTFSQVAITEWARSHNTCPVCRAVFTAGSVDLLATAALEILGNYDAALRLSILMRPENLRGVALVREKLTVEQVAELFAASGRNLPGSRVIEVPRDYPVSWRNITGNSLTPGTLWNPASGCGHYGSYMQSNNSAFVRVVMGDSELVVLVISKYVVRHGGGTIELLRKLGQEGCFVWDCFQTCPGLYVVFMADRLREGGAVEHELYKKSNRGSGSE
jgi:hypothetical protein